jgi:7-carboxy-7-deazaguanine synthase
MMGPDLSIRPGLADLTQRLKALGKHITIETSGALFVPDLACDLMSISPKLANSLPSRADGTGIHQADRLDLETLHRLIHGYPYQLKFVVESAEDVAEIQGVLGGLGEHAPERVMLMSQATTTAELLSRSPAIADACRQTGLRFGQRLHVLLWDRQRGV